MSELVRFELEKGGQILVEVDDGAFGVERASRESEHVIRAAQKLESALSMIRPTVGAILDVLRGSGAAEKQVQFGVKLNGEVGAFIGKVGTESHFQVTLTWKALEDEAV